VEICSAYTSISATTEKQMEFFATADPFLSSPIAERHIHTSSHMIPLRDGEDLSFTKMTKRPLRGNAD
jgi:hypothetical protein